MSLDKIAYKLAMHLIGVHCNSSAIEMPWEDLADSHQHEHFGPGGIRHHLYTDLGFSEELVEAVLEEAEQEMGPAPKRLCPDDGICGHFCKPGSCFRVTSCGPFTGVYEGDDWPLGIRLDEMYGRLEG